MATDQNKLDLISSLQKAKNKKEDNKVTYYAIIII